MRRIIHVWGVLFVLVSIGSQASAQGRGGAAGATGGTGATGAAGATGATGATGQVPAGAQTVEYDHLTDPEQSYERHLKNGERFYVVIRQTCPDVFSYDVHGIVREQKPAGSDITAKAGKALETKVIPVVHDAKYGGYYVTIDRTASTAVCDGGEKLEKRTLMIFTPQQDWDLSFSGAFTVSSLSNPVYYLRAHPDDATKKQVQQDTDKSDAVNLGIGAFVHLFHQRLPWVAGAFGLGIREGNKMEYFLGGGVRASDKATINAGLVFGPVNRLPNGVDTTRPVSDDNVLTDLPTRIKRGFFVSISYSFINVKNRFEAPFAGTSTPAPPAAPAPPAPAAAGGGQNAAAACTVTFEPASIDFAPAGEKKPVTVKTSTTGCAWKLTEKPAWLHVRTSGGTEAENGTGETALSLEADANDTPNDRPAASVKIGNGTLPVTQKKRP